MQIILVAVERDLADAWERHCADVPGVAVHRGSILDLKVDAVEPVPKLKLPDALLSPRQREILAMLYDQEMDVAEIATALGIDPQTVRSAHHKAMLKLRAHFKSDS